MKRGIWFGTAVFDGARETEIKALLKSAGLPSSGKTPLFDGMLGDQFEQPANGWLHLHAEAVDTLWTTRFTHVRSGRTR